MQLMPALAVDLAKDALPGFAPDDLYRAGVNARLGTLELTLLHTRFGTGITQPSLPLVIAGYNGGSDAVARWMGTYTTAPEADRFAEDISFTETRRYVRRVLGYLMAYRRAYGDR
jgi:soluble lytic murein transglycosylase